MTEVEESNTRSQPPNNTKRPSAPPPSSHAPANTEPAKPHGAIDQTERDEGPPPKKQRVSEAASIPRPKPESPPWKKIVAEGPSSFTQDGRRKSGRTNHIPFELQPPSDRRQTRGIVQKTTPSTNKNGKVNGHQAKEATTTSTNGNRKAGTNGATSTHHALQSQSPSKSVAPPKRSLRKSMPSEQKQTPVRNHKRSPSPKAPQSAPTQPRPDKLRRLRRDTNNGEEATKLDTTIIQPVELPAESPKAKLSRIKILVKPASIPITHPGLELQRPKKYTTLGEFFEAAEKIPVEDGGLYVAEDLIDYPPESVLRDGLLLTRLEEAAKPGGLLSPEFCSAYERPQQDHTIPMQYAHLDHVNRAAIGFQRLMEIEKRKHMSNAKKLAEACRDEWKRRQPKSLEQLEVEQTKISQSRYRFLVKTLQATWANARAEVNRRRLVEWQAQEQERVRRALNEAVDKSTLKLQAQGAFRDSEVTSEDDETQDSEGGENIPSDSEGEDGESNMSSTDSEGEEEQPSPDAAEDELLTQEQLKVKYSGIETMSVQTDEVEVPDVEMSDVVVEPGLEVDGIAAEDSDESIDMDDDSESSDEESDDDEGGGSSEDESDGNAGSLGLLGFLDPGELKAMKLEKDVSEQEPTATELDSNHNGTPLIVEDGVQDDLPVRGIIDVDDETSTNSSIGVTMPNKKIQEVAASSPDHSSLPTPRTTETRPSEVDSASSVELHRNSRQVSQSTSPQPTSNPKTPIPHLLRGTLREYQHDGLDWLAGLYKAGTNGILADEMGLGKTIQTIALLAHLACEHEVWGPHLVIVPTSVMLNWEMEFKKWCPGFKILTYYGSPEERKRKRSGWNGENSWNVCITSYQLILRDQVIFKRRQWHYMILDEAHNIKNFQSQRWQAMLTFSTRARLLLTGTPLQNNLTELWSLLYFLMPSDGTEPGVGGFANLKEFQDWFKKPSEQILEHGREQMDDESKAIIGKLHKVLRPYLLRRLKADVEKQMPAKYEHVEFCRLSKRQRELYDSFLSRDDTRGTLASGNYLSIINCLMQLRKVCNHPDLFLDRPIMTSFPMEKSAIADFEIKELLVRRRLFKEEPMSKVSLEFLNLVPTKHERLSTTASARIITLSAQQLLMKMREAQRQRAHNSFTQLNPATANSNLVYLESASRWGRFEELQHCVYLNALRRQQKPIYGKELLETVTLGLPQWPNQPKPKKQAKWLDWISNYSPVMNSMVPTLAARSNALDSTIRKFACVTPPVVAKDISTLVLKQDGIVTLRSTVDSARKDPFHEARMRLSIQFPDKRLLQYDCGKLQALAKLLRRLEAGGHRVLIFTQMTKVLDILEQFLNIHGHKYLRLDGNTKVEQRQILTDRFNNDTRILAFILSSRSGGLGINLTGADTVIFYDLDWNPAMDAQCQDRCHRIGQTREVHIYRLVSEHTIEANILRKANQKRMLDDVVIQEGEFTTDYFNKPNKEVIEEDETTPLDEDAAAASAAMDRVLGGPGNNKNVQRVLAQAEDREDVAAARVAEREINETDAADFDENTATATTTPAAASTPQELVETPGAATPTVEAVMEPVEEEELNAWGGLVKSTDDYMLQVMTEELKDAPVELPRDKSKKGKDRSHRSHRAR
ncbi:hypothetical protein HYFRA_00011888 [Hymenoscyphus fraxineus]|uniref:DNA helicase n=1 Tax=Hymenoscyphus fraxineus TaxID=746836 RepID=A0A9N9L0L8_9HELO|nr:hypothetical protein HYFRA_00011888 [Hymenoscyphus fraxineus]